MSRVTNPGGRFGSPAHRIKVDGVADDIANRGLQPVKEYRVKVPGRKIGRYADVVGVDDQGNIREIHQIGRTTQVGAPVAREIGAINDIEEATGIRVSFRSYNR